MKKAKLREVKWLAPQHRANECQSPALSTQASLTQKPGPVHVTCVTCVLGTCQTYNPKTSDLLPLRLIVHVFVLKIYIDKPVSAKATPGLIQDFSGKPGKKHILELMQRPGTGKCWERKGSLWRVLHLGRNLIFS